MCKELTQQESKMASRAEQVIKAIEAVLELINRLVVDAPPEVCAQMELFYAWIEEISGTLDDLRPKVVWLGTYRGDEILAAALRDALTEISVAASQLQLTDEIEQIIALNGGWHV